MLHGKDWNLPKYRYPSFNSPQRYRETPSRRLTISSFFKFVIGCFRSPFGKPSCMFKRPNNNYYLKSLRRVIVRRRDFRYDLPVLLWRRENITVTRRTWFTWSPLLWGPHSKGDEVRFVVSSYNHLMTLFSSTLKKWCSFDVLKMARHYESIWQRTVSFLQRTSIRCLLEGRLPS
jgi:hypothetical protein